VLTHFTPVDPILGHLNSVTPFEPFCAYFDSRRWHFGALWPLPSAPKRHTCKAGACGPTWSCTGSESTVNNPKCIPNLAATGPNFGLRRPEPPILSHLMRGGIWCQFSVLAVWVEMRREDSVPPEVVKSGVAPAC